MYGGGFVNDPKRYTFLVSFRFCIYKIYNIHNIHEGGKHSFFVLPVFRFNHYANENSDLIYIWKESDCKRTTFDVCGMLGATVDKLRVTLRNEKLQFESNAFFVVSLIGSVFYGSTTKKNVQFQFNLLKRLTMRQ